MAEDPSDEDRFRQERERMVDRQLLCRGISDARVLDAMRRVPRHAFVPEALVAEAYADHPLPIGEGQTISQPYIVGLMTEALGLTGEEKVLEIGTGSGYQTAILTELAARVFTVERSVALSRAAEERLRRLGYATITFRIGDGTLGLPEDAPFDRILATGSLPRRPRRLLQELGQSGTFVLPVGNRSLQELVAIRREGSSFKETALGPCAFVPLVGQEGWAGPGCGGTSP